MKVTRYKYCPCYCEENIWHLVQEPEFASAPRAVALIYNAELACLFWDQRPCKAPHLPVWWDYHVILFVYQKIWRVYDLDSSLPLPVDARTYLDRTFRHQEKMPEAFRPCFVLFEGNAYVDAFYSDRSHMLDESGAWQSPPPPWPAIGRGRGEGFLALVDRGIASGAAVSLADMYDRFANRQEDPAS